MYLEENNPEQAESIIKEALQLLELQDEGMLRAKLYRLLGIVFHEKNNRDQSYYFLRMSHDLLKRIAASREADISQQLIRLSLQEPKMSYEDYKSYIR